MAPRKVSVRPPISQDEADRIISLYLSGLSSERVAAVVGRSVRGVSGVVRRHGVTRPVSHHKRVYFPREGVFDNPEADEKAAYVLGFYLADGCIIDRPRRAPFICLELKASDRDHVETIASFFGLPGEAVKLMHGGRSAALKFSSSRLAESFAKYGVVPSKSLIAEPKLITNNRHFWRGVCDGDGCLHFQKSKRKHSLASVASLSLVGSLGTIRAFAAYSQLICPDGEVSVTPRGSVWGWQTCGSVAMRMIRHLYTDCTIALPRKLAIAQEMMVRMVERGSVTVEREDTPQAQHPRGRRFLTHAGETLPVAEWSSRTGIPAQTITARLRHGWTIERALTETVEPGHGGRLLCVIPECNRPHWALGFCSMHYRRRQRGLTV